MTRHVADSSEKHAEAFKDFEPYQFTLVSVAIAPPDAKFQNDSVLFTWSYDAMPEITLRTYAAIKFGEHQGRVAKLRAISNALFGKPERARISAFDDERLEVEYPGEAPKRLAPGLKLIARGEFSTREDGSQSFTLNRFSAVGAAPEAQQTSLPAAPPVAGAVPATEGHASGTADANAARDTAAAY